MVLGILTVWVMTAVIPEYRNELSMHTGCYRLVWLNTRTVEIEKGSCVEEARAKRIASKMNRISRGFRFWVEQDTGPKPQRATTYQPD